MPKTIANSWFIVAGLAMAIALPATAQKYTPEPPPLTAEPCKPTKKKPCPPPDPAPAAATAPANQFPFPGEEPEAAPAAAKPGSAAPAQSAFPFPGEPAPDPATANSTGSSSSSSSSSSDPNPDPDHPALADEGSSGSTRFSRKKLPKVRIVDNDARGSEDIEVSRYYFSTGNFQAAYLRAKDATATIPDDPGAHLALAEAAKRLHKNDEATTEYNAALKLDPSDQQKKEASKALLELAFAKPAK